MRQMSVTFILSVAVGAGLLTGALGTAFMFVAISGIIRH